MSYATRTMPFLSVLDALACVFRGQEKLCAGEDDYASCTLEDEGLNGKARETQLVPAHMSKDISFFAPHVKRGECGGRFTTEII